MECNGAEIENLLSPCINTSICCRSQQIRSIVWTSLGTSSSDTRDSDPSRVTVGQCLNVRESSFFPIPSLPRVVVLLVMRFHFKCNFEVELLRYAAPATSHQPTTYVSTSSSMSWIILHKKFSLESTAYSSVYAKCHWPRSYFWATNSLPNGQTYDLRVMNKKYTTPLPYSWDMG